MYSVGWETINSYHEEKQYENGYWISFKSVDKCVDEGNCYDIHPMGICVYTNRFYTIKQDVCTWALRNWFESSKVCSEEKTEQCGECTKGSFCRNTCWDLLNILRSQDNFNAHIPYYDEHSILIKYYQKPYVVAKINRIIKNGIINDSQLSLYKLPMQLLLLIFTFVELKTEKNIYDMARVCVNQKWLI
jgi:hypothetical protein